MIDGPNLPLFDARAFERCPRCGRRQTRTTLQNARLWRLYARIADEVMVEDDTGKLRKYSAAAWHEHYKRQLLGFVNEELPGGHVITRARSTRALNVGEFTAFMSRVEDEASKAGVFLE